MHLPSYEKGKENYFNPFSYVFARLGVSAGQIATEIETNGIYGWDRFQRFKHFEPQSQEALEALDLLASGVAHNERLECEGDQFSPTWPTDGERTRDDRYGWTDLDMPKFVKVNEPIMNPSSRTRLANSEAKLVAALLYEKDFKFDRNRVRDMQILLERAGIELSEKPIRDALDRARQFFPN